MIELCPLKSEYQCLRDSVDIWLIDLNSLKYNEEQCWRVLDATEKRTAENFRLPELRHNYIKSHSLLRHILASYLPQLSAETLMLARTPYGKPYVLNAANLQFNLSHTKNWLLIGVTIDTAIGVDIELIKSRGLLDGMVKKCFAQREQDYWFKLPQTQQLEMFYVFWTRKEALVKAVGRGIALGLNQCELDLLDFRRFLSLPAECGEISDWQVLDINAEPSVKAALVVKGREGKKYRNRIVALKKT